MKTAAICVLALGVALAGCATKPRPVPMSLMDIVSMTKAGATDDEIIARIQQSRTVFYLAADQIVMLRKEGVSERVVNYMLDSYTRAAVAAERDRTYYYGYGGYPGWGWGWSWGYGHHHGWCW